jgi:predicted nucleic acid-binding protein
MARLVLTDTSPLIGLSRVDGLHWLAALFGTVEMTREVHDELNAGLGTEPRIARALDEGDLTISKRPPCDLTAPPQLGSGEWSSIQAALQHDGPTLLLLDERLARREAKRLGLQVAGTAAIIGLAEQQALTPSARAAFETLLHSDFRIAASVIRDVLSRLNKAPR